MQFIKLLITMHCCNRVGTYWQYNKLKAFGVIKVYNNYYTDMIFSNMLANINID